MSSVYAGPLYAHPLFQQLTGGAWRPGGLELTRHGLALCGFTPGMRVADVGCGAGATLELLQAAGLRAVGLDVAVHEEVSRQAAPEQTHPEHAAPEETPPAQAPLAQAPLAQADPAQTDPAQADPAQAAPEHISPPPVSRICAHAGHLPLATAVLDGLLCECVLSLLEDTEAVLKGFARVLRPGGALLLSDLFVPGAASLSAPAGGPSCADNALPQAALERALARSGFGVERFEDHTALLRPLAAQLLWHGLRCSGIGTGPSGGGRGCGARLGYGLWIARRMV